MEEKNSDKARDNKNESIDIVLTIDIGAINTRVSLFERENGRYQFTGTASARTVYSDGGEVEYISAAGAVRKLESALDRHFLDDMDRIITPQKLGMIGADQVVVSWSGGEMPRVVLMGLADESSIKTMEDLLRKNGLTASAKICAMDGRSLTENVGALTASDPDIVLVSGGSEHGAEHALYRLGEILLLACKSIDEKNRPEILFMGNSGARGQYEKVFHPLTKIGFSDNIMGTKDARLSPTTAFQKCMLNFGKAHNPVLEQLQKETGCTAISGDFAYGRCIRLLSRINRANHSVLGIEVGASRTIAAFGANMDLEMNRFEGGIGRTLPKLLEIFPAEEILPWINFQLKETELKDYILNKSLRPELVPANSYSAEIEQTLAHFLIRAAAENNPSREQLYDGTLGTVVLGGAVLRNVEDPGDALRIGMDSLRPFGMTDYYLDMNGLASAIGALAGSNRELAAQVTSPAMFLNLGRVVTPRSNVKEGKRAFSVSLRDDAGNMNKVDVIQGGISRIPLEYGRYYELDWFNVNKSVTIPGVPTWTTIGFKAGCFGLVFDMRGETLEMPKDRAAQIHLLDRWKNELGSWKNG
ncbi:MAG: glutamate mutase L [Anaerolineaceae bacterium]|nr:glutamate mutase L [Anaerolineaceae bacterium]